MQLHEEMPSLTRDLPLPWTNPKEVAESAVGWKGGHGIGGSNQEGGCGRRDPTDGSTTKRWKSCFWVDSASQDHNKLTDHSGLGQLFN